MPWRVDETFTVALVRGRHVRIAQPATVTIVPPPPPPPESTPESLT